MDAPRQEQLYPGAEPATATAADGGALRVAFHTLGCRLNQYDTESLRLRLGELRPLQVVPWDEPADLYVLNSCTVTAKAEHECRRLARQAKQRHPGCRVVVAGCYAQTQPGALAALPEIDVVVGNTAKEDVAAWLPRALGGAGERVHVAPFAARAPFDAAPLERFAGHSRAFVKVQDGCDLRCSYCAIWQARGPGRSRPAADVIAQLERLATTGYREAVLTGVHLGGWGRDLPGRERLPGLLRRCLAALPDLRLRLSSIHPDEVGPDLLAVLAAEPRLRPHLHLSLQSGADSVLRRMRRPYSAADARRALAGTAALGDHWGIGADVITGFPGETAAEFAETLALLEDSAVRYLHVFRFSARPGTAAATMPDPVPGPVSAERAATLRAWSAARQARSRAAAVGRRCEAIVENGTEVPGCHQATTDNHHVVHLPARPGDGLRPGGLYEVRIEREQDGRLFGAAVCG